ncbi:MAG TPA: VanZ family protein [Thermoleophilaceae bacterium]|nr:VanZ family protein [Thermoleophilaceae bacterium]
MRVSALRKLDPWLPPLLMMAVIFFFSAQPSLDSGLGLVDLVGRKLVHFAEYALLCVLLWRALRRLTNGRRAVLIAFAISSVYAASDEYHQTFVEGRSGRPLDWVIDSAGAGAAALRLRARERQPLG